MAAACPACGCTHAQGLATHAVRAALIGNDFDLALTLGLLDVAICEGCDHACTMVLLGTRETRIRALAARDRFRAREARLERRSQERIERRSSATAPGSRATTSTLPAAAAAALARAKAKAAIPR